jgi:hypothetical protein
LFSNIIEEITSNVILILYEYIRITVLAKTSSNLAVSSKVVRQKSTVMNPAGPGTKNDCAAEDQQQITALLWLRRVNRDEFISL